MRTEDDILERLEALRKHKSSPHFLRGIGKVKQGDRHYVHGTKAVYICALEWVLCESMKCPHCGKVIEEPSEVQ